MSTQKILDKYFKDDRVIYFNSSDVYRFFYGEPYLTYKKENGIHLILGNNDGEICILHTSDEKILENIIKLIIFN